MTKCELKRSQDNGSLIRLFSQCYLTGTNDFSAISDYETLITPSDISLKEEDSGTNDTPRLNVTRLKIFGLGDRPDGEHFPVVQAGPGLWKVEDPIAL